MVNFCWLWLLRLKASVFHVSRRKKSKCRFFRFCSFRVVLIASQLWQTIMWLLEPEDESPLTLTWRFSNSSTNWKFPHIRKLPIKSSLFCEFIYFFIVQIFNFMTFFVYKDLQFKLQLLRFTRKKNVSISMKISYK